MEFVHKSIMADDVIENLNIKPDGIYLDGTLGGGGHSSLILERLDNEGHLYGIDQDEDAINAASKRLERFENKTIIRSNYCNAVSELKLIGVTGVDGILLDLGVSSYQLDEPERGFTYNTDAALDMRMDRRKSLTAREIVNTYSESELKRILKEYGEEPFAAAIAKNIVAARSEKPVETTFELKEIIKKSILAKMRAKGGHPSKRTYQAIRIECNGELDVLKESIDGMIDFLNPGGRFCIITFHSLEDRIVKNMFKKAEDPCECPKNLPCVCGKKSRGRVISRKPIVPSEAEMEENPRSKSSKLRVFEKV
ncbi:MAG: 16S rRNA (cytosine(1402)-N(4))-methyltransferase RsmH [Lachnospiraceae bacterium]|nr:16S rRNA (cytosine(1402)-N(4))-methyltransferase RsmH [Lachnospiraceae bacterium]